MTKTPINIARTFYGDSIIRFPLYNNTYAFFGVGKVVRISKGKENDVVYVAFYPQGKEEMATIRTVIVGGNHPRRQLLTLKKGQYASFYGRCVIEFTDREINGKIVKTSSWHLFAYAVQGWYVPNAFDVKKAHKDKVDEELFTEMSESEESLLNDIVNNLFENKGEFDEEE